MKFNKWTLALAAGGVLSLGSVAQAEEAAHNQVMTALSSTTLSGYVSTSAIWKFGTGNANLPGRSYDGPSKQDSFNLDVIKLSLEKPLSEEQWSAGYKTELLFGPDANTFNTTSAGVPANQDFAIKQAYVALRAPVGNGIDFKMGVWDTIIGYEVFDAGSNPNYSRSYGYFLEPTTYTGLQASYHITDWFSVSAGVADAGAPTINGHSYIESVKSYMGSFVLTATESMGFLKGAALYGGIIDHGKSAAGTTDIFNFYGGVTIPTPIEALSFGAAYDYRGAGNKEDPGEPGFINGSYANAVGVYSSWRFTEKMKLNVRGEYASGSPGSFGAGAFDVDPNGTLHGEKFIGVTTTFEYALWENLLSRLEFRWDHDASGGNDAFGGSRTGIGGHEIDASYGGNYNGYGSNSGTLKNACSIALNVIYKF